MTKTSGCRRHLLSILLLFGASTLAEDDSLSTSSCIPQAAAPQQKTVYITATKFDRPEKENRGYFFSNVKLNWYDAYNFCKRHGLGLLTIKNEQEQKDISGAALRFAAKRDTKWATMDAWNLFWTAGNDLHEERVWRWATRRSWQGPRIALRGEPLRGRYQDWYDGQPDNWNNGKGDFEHCMILWSWLGERNKTTHWNDLSCREEQYFICEEPRTPGPPPDPFVDPDRLE